MEGLKILEKSYNSLIHFREAISNDSFNHASQLIIDLNNYDMETKAGLKNSISAILNVYKDKLDINISKILAGNLITINFPKDLDDFKYDMVDNLKSYITKRSPVLWNSISNNNSFGGIYSV